MTEHTITDTYAAVATAPGWVVQNTGSFRIHLFITDGTAPINERGFILDPKQMIRDVDLNITGTVYARTEKGSVSYIMSSE